MNEEPPPPFDTVGDESVEARIVAWVLGETSAFEAAELERLCEERPELLVFRRRMLALHGLLTEAEAEAAEKDRSWKLPAEKRQVLDEIFGEEGSTECDPQKERSVQFSARRAFFAVAACLLLTAIIAGLSAPMVIRQRKRADGVVRHVDFMPSSGGGGNSEIAPQAAAPSTPPADGSYRLESKQSQSNRELGMLKTKEQSMLAKSPAKSKPRVAASAAPTQAHLPPPVESAVMDPLPPIVASGLSGAGEGRVGGGFGGGARTADADGLATPAAAPAAMAHSDAFAMSDAPSRNRLAEGMDVGKDADQERPRPAARGKKADASEMAARLDRDAVITGASSEVTSLGDKENAPGGQPQVLAAKDAAPPAPAQPSGHTWAGSGSLAFRREINPEGDKSPSAGAALESLVLESQSQVELKPVDELKKELAESEKEVVYSDSSGDGVESNESIRSNPAVTSAPAEPVDQMRRTLHRAEGNLNLGKYDEAKKAYQAALEIDPYNSAARRGIEKAEAASNDYYRAAIDHTRAELLSQVDSAWELTVPAEPANERLPAEDAQLLADLANEIPAAETPYSTFSLNISDASFQLAKAALAKGERPDPASIKPEQFYNAVDYGDPAPASNEPVAATIEQSAHPVIPGRNLVRVALRTGSVGRSAVQPLRLTLLVDQSGSMVREDRRASMEHALAQLGVLLTKNDLVTVIGFSRTPHLLAEGKAADETLKLAELINQTASEGGTNLEEAMKLGGQLAQRYQLAGAQNRIVLFTDGAANLGDANPARLAEQVKAFRQKGLAFDIAGIGTEGLNDRLLSELARNGNGRYYVVGDEKNDSFARQLAGAFRPAAENVKVQVNFNPQRVGKYKLIGFEKDRLKTEDFRNDAVDAAELAAEEAGVAIYQVEPLPDGTGEIGEVSVRFRDAAGKEMVERTWTIPYESQATAFDRATPSMQLAGLSLLAAEKLRGGPLADAIDFKQLTGPSAFVKQFYGSSPRVADMLRVIDALK